MHAHVLQDMRVSVVTIRVHLAYLDTSSASGTSSTCVQVRAGYYAGMSGDTDGESHFWCGF